MKGTGESSPHVSWTALGLRGSRLKVVLQPCAPGQCTFSPQPFSSVPCPPAALPGPAPPTSHTDTAATATGHAGVCDYQVVALGDHKSRK